MIAHLVIKDLRIMGSQSTCKINHLLCSVNILQLEQCPCIHGMKSGIVRIQSDCPL